MSHELRLERLFDASPEEVFDAFTDPAAHEEWFLDRPGSVVTSTIDLRVGGTWDVSFGPAGEAPYREVNVFRAVDPPSRLAYSSAFVMPDGSSFDTDLVITFEARAGKTLMTIVQTGFEGEQDRDDHRGGWPGFLDRIDQVVAERRRAR
jgi:glutathione S-transferase